MSGQAATGGIQWQQGDTLVVLDVAPAEISGGLSRLWQRVLDGVDSLGEGEWERPTRCSEWKAVDIANHLSDTASWVTQLVADAAAGRPSHVFDGFEPRGVPKRLTDAADRTPAVAARRLRESLEGLGSLAAGLDFEAMVDERVDTPLGAQPSAVGFLHLFWDTWLHERDLFLPLDREVPEREAEVRLAALYTLRMEGYIHDLLHRRVSTLLDLHGAFSGCLLLQAGPGELRVEQVPDGTPAEHVLHGDAATVVDALCGRGDLTAALAGEPDGLATVSSIRAVLAG
jgi:uncharacterized protein (TIGR03083 family)